MKNLSPKQLDALHYLHAGNVIEVCTSVGRALGQMTFSHDKPEGVTKAVLDTLYTWGLVRAREEYSLGLRWAVFSLSRKGRNVVALAGEVTDAV